MRAGERNLMLLFLVIAGGATLVAFSFQQPEARLFPLMAGATTTFLILAYFVIDAVPALRRVLHAYIEDDIFMKISAASASIEEDEAEEAAELTHHPFKLTDDERRQRERKVIGLLVGFLVLAWLAGLAVACPVLLMAYMVGYSRRSWAVSLIVTAATSAFVYLVFVVVLQLPLHFGVLGDLL